MNEVFRLIRSVPKLGIDRIDLFLIALSLVLLFFWGSRLSAGYGSAWDTQHTVVEVYTRVGNDLINGNGFYMNTSDPYPTFFGPVYPTYIGLMDKQFGHGRFKLLAINFVALALVILLIRRATEKLTGNSKLALAVSVFLLFWPDFMISAARTQPEFLAAVLAITGVIIWTIRRGDKKTAIFTGMALGLAALTRSEYLALIAVMSIAIGLSRQNWKLGIITGLAAMVLVFPWVTFVSVDHGKFIPVNLGGGLSLLLGVAQLQDSEELGIKESDKWARCCDGRADLRDWSAERENYRVGMAIGLALDHPGWYVTHLWRRWIQWLNTESPVLENVIYFLGANWFYYLMFLAKFLVIVTFIAALAQLVRMKKLTQLLPVLIIPVYLAILFTPFRLETRYIVAAWPMIFIAIAVMLNQANWYKIRTYVTRRRTH